VREGNACRLGLGWPAESRLNCCNRRCPLICLLSPGADPTKLIEDLAKKKKIKTLGVSMGQVCAHAPRIPSISAPTPGTNSFTTALSTWLQGQEVIARKYMATASLEGQWVLLQNTHLGLGYLTEVETFLVRRWTHATARQLALSSRPHVERAGEGREHP
jgi:dynein heavy chain